MKESHWENTSAPKNTREQKSAFDEKWFRRFLEHGNFQAYEYFEGDKEIRSREKRAFLSGKKENPDLDYPLLDPLLAKIREQSLLSLKENILEQESNQVVREVYRWRVNEKIAEIRMIQAAAAGNMRKFKRYTEYIYGKPDPEIAQYTFNEVHRLIEKGESSGNLRAQEIATSLKLQIPPQKNSFINSPSEKSQLFVQETTAQEFSSLINIPTKSKGERWQAEEIKTVFEKALEKIQANGWISVIAKTDRSGINTSQENKEVQVPTTREVFTKKLQGLLVHEIGTHVKRRVRGERSKLLLLSLGLDRYEIGEEGITTLREKSLSNSFKEFSGIDSHLPICLAYDGEGRDFHETFSTIVLYYELKNLLEGKNNDEARQKAEDAAWNRCVRTFRGTNSKTKGVCFTKDLIYREGNIAVWDTVSKNIPGTNTPEMFRWSIGKYDPSNDRHIWVLNELGITDEDLTALESDR
jgi:hypothetical protein